MADIVSKRFLVSGKVQGVFFRASTREQANQLGVSGWARNLPDGRVEVVAAGDPGAVSALEEWLWQGSPAADVDNVEAQHSDEQPSGRFSIA
ncbi:acylphosphatase [Natronospira proteinivora]|uniref:Acylphosphatase n=1 Tax=Natronospira proteinivora TaxID=1807133 RepID=A0ABT1G4E4_9GAMM|nr:acylphosphatase [Natronospira proteinivora]MCP1726171.1 acylphosphatase [Natronospira proteinivora]